MIWPRFFRHWHLLVEISESKPICQFSLYSFIKFYCCPFILPDSTTLNLQIDINSLQRALVKVLSVPQKNFSFNLWFMTLCYNGSFTFISGIEEKTRGWLWQSCQPNSRILQNSWNRTREFRTKYCLQWSQIFWGFVTRYVGQSWKDSTGFATMKWNFSI
mgnify:CR=1 FL=1